MTLVGCQIQTRVVFQLLLSQIVRIQHVSLLVDSLQLGAVEAPVLGEFRLQHRFDAQ